jgi:DNA helicase IV
VSGVPAVIGVAVAGNTAIANWVKDRVSEIVQNTEGILPSIAILVESEDRVEPLAKQLNAALQEFNIKVEACVNGKNLGTKSTVRVFCVDHIKGLEFEGVFFVNIDKLEKIKENSFKNFLYVGASRAAKFFGVTTEGTDIPQQLSGVEHLFVQDWQQEETENIAQEF